MSVHDGMIVSYVNVRRRFTDSEGLGKGSQI